MQLTFWGARGSIPTPGAATVRYGGNTSCLELRASDGSLLILDGGTGIRGLGEALHEIEAPLTTDVLITHAHWDHVQGLPFFAPLYRASNAIRIWGAGGSASAVQRVVRAQMEGETFPIGFGALAASVELGELPATARIGSFLVEHLPASHQGGAVGFRVREGNEQAPALVYLPDNELGAPEAHGLDARWRDRLLHFIDGAALLVHDAMYTESEYVDHAGWGHSRMEESLIVARSAGVRTLALFHHHPSRTDDALDHCLSHCRREAELQGGPEVIAAAEGVTLTV